MPAHATALGKTLLAHHRYLATELASGDLPGFTPATITDGHRLNGSLDEISGRGWAVEVEELFLGVAAIAAPIEDRRRVIAGAIGISGSIQRICQDRSPRAELVGYVMESARSVSRELGGIPCYDYPTRERVLRSFDRQGHSVVEVPGVRPTRPRASAPTVPTPSQRFSVVLAV